ncbi:MAG: DNA alkylation repair protein [Thermomicrobiales bacterium]
MPETAVDEQFEAVRSALQAAADPEAAEKDRTYHKYDGYQSYGVMRDPFTKIIRELRPGLRSLDLQQRLDLADQLVGTGFEEEARVAVWLLRDTVKRLNADHLQYLDRFAGRMRSWSTTDDFSVHVIKPLLDAYPCETLDLLWRWNQSDDRWKQRASVVAFTRRKGDAGDLVEETLEYCEQLIWSEDDLVRKGVGWALRDAVRAAKDQVLPYVVDLRRRGVSSVITLYALRDIKGEERERAIAVKSTRQHRE